MKKARKILGGACVILFLILLPAACRRTVAEPLTPAPTPTPASAPLEIPLPGEEPQLGGPAATTQIFYAWYLKHASFDRLLESERAYYLTPRLRQILAGHRGNFDPILMAQEVPQHFAVEAWYEQETEAGVIVHFPNAEESMYDLSVVLRPVAGTPSWQIDKIIPGNMATPAGVVTRFLQEYAGPFLGENRPPDEDHYRTMTALDGALVAEVEARRDEGVAYDPLLQAEVVPQRYRVDEIEIMGERATVVCLLWWPGSEIPSPLTFSLKRRGETWAITATKAPNIVPAPEEVPSPQAVVETFFSDYLAAGGFAAGAHMETQALHPIFAASLAEMVDRWQGEGIVPRQYDPVLQGLLPEEPERVTVTVDPAEIGGDRARLLAWRRWEGAPEAVPLTVILQLTPAGRWQIVEMWPVVTPPSIFGAAPTLESEGLGAAPAHVVAARYSSAVAYADALAQPPEAGSRLGLPAPAGDKNIFCAAAVPQGLAVTGTVVLPDEGGSERALAVVQTTLEKHAFTVALEQAGGRWEIEAVHCADTPTGVTQAFYTWYLAYTGLDGNYRLQNRFDDDRYADGPFLAPSFIAEVNALRREGAPDPFIYATTVPDSFTVEDGPGAEQATVTLRFAGGDDSRRQRVVVTTAAGDRGRLLVATWLAAAADLAPPAAAVTVDTSAWLTYTDDIYPFSFRIPPGWEVEALDTAGLGPEERYRRVLAIYSKEVRAARAAGLEATASGWPVQLPVANAVVIEGDAAAVARAHIPPVASYEVAYNGYPVTVEQEGEEFIVYRYLFEHPEQEVWVVFQDFISAFPGRETYAAEVQGMLPGILSTFHFE